MEIIENSIAKISACTAIEITTTRWLKSSATEARNAARRNGRRFSRGWVSGRRTISQIEAMLENSTKAQKMPRQLVASMITAPIEGASAGNRVNTIITKDMMRAISRPE